ncbi:hypothetical protein [Paludibaculum fermentans]|uniref:hypothetical protein n=1 Tax=Paludibaculum fermentans TaxID=1473598 RepID=UPI003EBE92B2
MKRDTSDGIFQLIQAALALFICCVPVIAADRENARQDQIEEQSICPDTSQRGTVEAGFQYVVKGKISGLYHGILAADDRCPSSTWPLIKGDDGAANEALETLAVLIANFNIRVELRCSVVEKQGFVVSGVGAQRRGNGFGYRGLHARALKVSRIHLIQCTERTASSAAGGRE